MRNDVQLNYNGCSMQLVINYKKNIYDQPRVGFESNLCPCPVLLFTICNNTPGIVVPALPENDAIILQIDTEFADVNTGNVLVIHGVYSNCIEAEIVEPSKLNGKVALYMDRDFVAQCICRYNW